MKGVNILVACVGLLGFLPLIVFLYGKRRANRILTRGRMVRANIYHIARGYKGNYQVVYYYFIGPDGREYKGRLTTKPGEYTVNRTVEVFYLPEDPRENTVKGTWNSNWFLAFVILIALAVLYMMYKLYQMLNP
jgi:hypothetical protein